jgi:hypothetical protein
MRGKTLTVALASAAFVVTTPNRASGQIFSGRDAGTGIVEPSLTNTPNSVAARMRFMTALQAAGATAGSQNTLESAPRFFTDDLGDGTRVTYDGQDPDAAGVVNNASFIGPGWNTTPGGA